MGLRQLYDREDTTGDQQQDAHQGADEKARALAQSLAARGCTRKSGHRAINRGLGVCSVGSQRNLTGVCESRIQLLAQLGGKLRAAAKTVGGILGHRLGEHRIQRGQLAAVGTDRGRRGVDVLADHHRRVGITIWRYTGQEVKCSAGQCILVCPAVDRITRQLLGRQVGHGAHGRAGRRQSGRVVDTPRKSEISQKHPPRLPPIGCGQQDVCRFDVAVE